MYQLILATGATNIVEAGTGFGVSTIYLALAIAQTTATTGKAGKVIATEKEARKVEAARAYWRQCGEVVEEQIELREGDLLETLREGVSRVDLLLLDSKSSSSVTSSKLGLASYLPNSPLLPKKNPLTNPTQFGPRSPSQPSKLSFPTSDPAPSSSQTISSLAQKAIKIYWHIYERPKTGFRIRLCRI